MVPIKNIGNLPPEFRRTERNEKQDQLRKTNDQGARASTVAKQPQNIAADQVSLSDSARTMLQRDAEVQRFTAEIPAVETLSTEERQEIEAKIESGFYTSNEVTSSIAGKISGSTNLDQADTAEPGITPTRMQQVLEKIQNNEYDSQSVLDIIADRILKDL